MESKPSTAEGELLADNRNTIRSSALIQGLGLPEKLGLLEKFAPFGYGAIPEPRLPVKGAGIHGIFSVIHHIARRTRAKLIAEVDSHPPLFLFRNPRPPDPGHITKRDPRTAQSIVAWVSEGVRQHHGSQADSAYEAAASMPHMKRDGWHHG